MNNDTGFYSMHSISIAFLAGSKLGKFVRLITETGNFRNMVGRRMLGKLRERRHDISYGHNVGRNADIYHPMNSRYDGL